MCKRSLHRARDGLASKVQVHERFLEILAGMRRLRRETHDGYERFDGSTRTNGMTY
jgi:hypothetical protein